MSFDSSALTKQAIITGDKIGVGGLGKSQMRGIRWAKSLPGQVFGAFTNRYQVGRKIFAQLSQN